MFDIVLTRKVTTMSLTETMEDEKGKYRKLAICNEDNEEVEIRFPVEPGRESFTTFGDAKDIVHHSEL